MHNPSPKSPEGELLEVLKTPKNWTEDCTPIKKK